MKSGKKLWIIIVCAVVLLLVTGIWALTVYIYNENFNRRFQS